MDAPRLERNVPLLFAVRICENLLGVISPIVVVFLRARSLTMTQVMLLETAFALAVIALEVPSGFFADRLGRRLSVTLGMAAAAGGSFIYAAGHGFAAFLAAEMVFAVGSSLISGADTAFLYDTLDALGRAEDYKRVEGLATFWALGAGAAAAVAGGLCAAADLRLPFVAAGGALAVGAVFAAATREAPRRPGGHPRGELYYLYKIGRFALYKNREVRWLIAFAAVLGGMGTVGFWLYQPYFELCGIPLPYFGVIFALFHLFAAFSGKAAFAVERTVGKRLALISLPVLLAASFLAMAAFVTPLGFLFVLCAQFVRGFANPVIQDYINRHTWSDKRATVMSIKNLLSRLVFVATAPFVGMAVDRADARLGLALAGAATIVGGGVLIVALRKDRVI
jgi:MFS family permease